MKYINKIFFALVLVSLLGSCKKNVVDLKPIDLIPAEKAFSTMIDLTSAVNGVYGTYLGRRASYVNAQIADEVRLGTGSEYRNVGNILFNWQHVSDSQDWRDDDNGGAWTNLYAVIDRANRVLELMAPVPTANATEAALKTQYRGEMLALRAIAHLELLRWFAETPEYTPARLGVIVQTEYVKAPGSYRPSRNSQMDVITRVNLDLAEARNLIPTSFTEISRITRNAIIAFQARTALQSKNWAEVITQASSVITLQPLTPRINYPFLWSTRSISPSNQSTEIIWRLNVQSSNLLSAAIGSMWQDINGAVQASAAVKLTNTFDKVNDIRWTSFFLPVTTPSVRTLIAKYGVVVIGNGENFQYDVKMIRTSELVLARAEAYAEMSNFPLANADLSAIRTARISGYVHVPINDKNLLITAILEERYKELCYEGHRYFDLKRRSLPIVRDLADAAGNVSITNLPVTDPKYLLPIPQQEIFANKNCQQNPGY